MDAWVQKAQQGDRQAFARLLDEHYAMIFRVALRFTGHVADAEDIAQDVCMGLVTKLSQFKHNSRFSTWLYRVTLNACYDATIKHQRQRQRDQESWQVRQLIERDTQDESIRKHWLYQAIAAMQEPLKTTAILVLLEEVSHAEAATIMECAESTISWRMHEIRKDLKQRMEQPHA